MKLPEEKQRRKKLHWDVGVAEGEVVGVAEGEELPGADINKLLIVPILIPCIAFEYTLCTLVNL
jgi:hypothetical protein